MATPPDAEDPARAQAALRDAPPFLTWRAIYVIVASALAVEVALFALLARVLG